MGPTKTEAEWRDLVAAMRQSGQSCTRWCKERGINPKTMGNWIRKLRLEGSAADNRAGFIEIGSTSGQGMGARQQKAGHVDDSPIQVRCAVCTMSFPATIDTGAVRVVLDTMMAP
jgi:hypothetical protein